MRHLFIPVLLLSIFLYSCSRKTQPAETVTTETTTVKKPVKKVTTVPKVITVNDKAATRSVDGRYYYDLDGRRYWRNKRDGKYYLFHKSMFNNPDFQP